MIDIGQSLLRAQKGHAILAKDLLIKCVLTYGSTTYTYTKTKIKQLTRTQQGFSHKAEVLIEDTDKALHSLDLEGYKAVISYGLITRAGEEWVAKPPMWVVSQQRDSKPQNAGGLECGLSLEGMFDRMARHKATGSYTPDSADTRTIKDWLIEMISLSSTSTSTDEEQTTSDSDMALNIVELIYAGQRLTISDRRVTKLAFKLKKVGTPSGNVAISIFSVATGNYLAYKIWGDAFNLGTTYAWKEVTFDAPILINEEVRIVCEFWGGDASNYVSMAYADSDEKASEYLTKKYSGDWDNETAQDAVYRYTWSATPVTVYNKYPAYGLVFDSEDDLIDSFIPADSFRINLNATRLQKVKELLRYTDCVAREGNDGNIHIRVPVTSGTTYDSEYSLVTGRDYHNFFSKRSRRRVVSPNYITFMSHPSYGDDYTGYAKDDSADLDEASGSGKMLEIETHYVRATSNAQCTNLATALLTKYQMENDKGSGIVVFVNFGQELYDYVNFADARAGDSQAGNIGHISEFYKRGQFNMGIGFGRLPLGIAIMGLDLAPAEAERWWPYFLQLQEQLIRALDSVIINDKNIETLFDAYNSQIEDAYFKKLTVTEEIYIPTEA